MNARHLSRRARAAALEEGYGVRIGMRRETCATNSELADLVPGPDADLIELPCGIAATAMQGQLRTRTNDGKHADPGPM